MKLLGIAVVEDVALAKEVHGEREVRFREVGSRRWG